jgi:uncharacterized RDD family membrane protein YckC
MDTNTTVENAQTKCVECGVSFAASDMIRFGDASVCGNCKPIFVQKLAEGAQIRTGMRYAGFWIRFGAYLIDSIIVGIVNAIIQMTVLFTTASGIGTAQPTVPTMPMVLASLLPFALLIAYETVMVGKYGATIGKLACHLKVVTADGASVSYGRAFGRYLGKLLSIFTLSIGFIIAAFDPEKRALHDRLCNTRVIEN